MDYGKAITIIRSAKGLSQKDLALLIGKTPSYISRLEKNERTPSSTLVTDMCKKLGVPEELFQLLATRYGHMDSQDKGLLEQFGAKLLKIITAG